MPFLPNSAEVQAIWSIDNQPWALCGFHYELPTGTVDQQLADDVAASLETYWLATIAPFTPTSTQLEYARVRDNSGPGFPFFTSQIDAPGTSGTAPLPLQVSLVTTERTSTPSVQGRTYWWGFNETHSVGTRARPSVDVISGCLSLAASMREISNDVVELGNQLIISMVGGSASGHAVTGNYRTISSTAEGWQTQRRRTDPIQSLI